MPLPVCNNTITINAMLQVQTTENFDAWHMSLDKLSRARVAARLLKLGMGLWGDCDVVGGGVTELREHFGPGLRIYVTQHGGALVVVLAGGSKRGQQRDIDRAIKLAAELKQADQPKE